MSWVGMAPSWHVSSFRSIGSIGRGQALGHSTVRDTYFFERLSFQLVADVEIERYGSVPSVKHDLGGGQLARFLFAGFHHGAAKASALVGFFDCHLADLYVLTVRDHDRACDE